MRHKAQIGLTILCVAIIVGTLAWRGRENQPRTRAFEFHYITRILAVPQGGKLRLWIPVPQSDGQQEISDLTVKSTVPYQLHQEPEYHNRYAYLEFTRPEVLPLEVRMDFKAKRREHRVTLGAKQEHPVPPQERPEELARSLQPDRLVPLDGMIAQLVAQQTRGLQSPLEKAQAIYNYIVSTMRYDKSGQGWGQGDAIYACTARHGNCTDFHALLIGMMRAAGIPARFEIGFSLPPDQNSGEIPGYHCWAQFWLDGVGWVPVDASEAWKQPAKRDYFFGAHDQHRLLFSRGRDIRFNPAQQGKPLNYFIYPYAELDGKPFHEVEYAFSFRDLESR